MAIAHLLDEAKFYWALLETAVRLERPWHPALVTQHHEAERHAVLLGRSIAGGGCSIDTLADLRQLIMQRIRSVLQLAQESLPSAGLPSHTLILMHGALEDVAEIATLLSQGVDVRNCRCTPQRSARGRLAQRMAPSLNTEQSVDAAAELIKLACVEAQRRMADCLADCQVAQHLQGAGQSLRH